MALSQSTAARARGALAESRHLARLVALVLGTAVLPALPACGPPTEESPRRLVLANVHVPGYPTAEGLRVLQREVAADSLLGGRFSIDLQLAGTLGNEKEALEKLRFGGIQMACVSAAPLTEFSDRIGVLTLPYLFDGRQQMWKVLEGEVGEELLAALREAGFVGLAWYEAGARSFYNSRRPIRTLEDLDGLKIRVQKSEIMRQTVAALGASPISLGFKQVYTNLHTGAIDGAENNLPSYRSERHFEVAGYYSYDRHSMIPDLLLIRRETWEGLSGEERSALRRAAGASSLAQRRLWDQYEEEALAAVLAAGSRVNEIAEREPFRRAVEPVYRAHRQQYGDLVERVRGRE